MESEDNTFYGFVKIRFNRKSLLKIPLKKL